MIKDNNKKQNEQQYDPMTELELTKLAEKIVAKMMRLKTVEDWFKHMARTKLADQVDHDDLELTEEEYAIGQVAKLMRLKTVEAFFKHLAKTDVANATDYYNLDLTEEQDAIGEVARLMTLMNLFQEDEEYEKCAIVKRRLDVVNQILKKYEDDEI